jgi:hypothetical protein
MSRPNPFSMFGLNGDGRFRSVTLELPSDRVARLLPPGIELGPQDVTAPGTHPVIISFNELSRVRTTMPSLMPTLSYREYTFGIPYSYATRGMMTARSLGPFYYMPRLFLDSFLAVMGGVMFWGYAKQSAEFADTDTSCSIRSTDDEPLTELTWTPAGDYADVDAYENFAPVRRMLDQPLISMLPPGIGTLPVIADFEKQWSQARLRPIETSLAVNSEFLEGFTPGNYPPGSKAMAPGIDRSVLGSYEYYAPWRLSMPYSPVLSR